MNIMIVDDEKLSAYQLRDNLREILSCDDQIEIFHAPEDALRYVNTNKNKIDIAFLDIEMGEISGVTLAKEIRIICPMMNIIFVTAYRGYAVDAMQIRASGYILKPASVEKIKEEMAHLRYLSSEKQKARPIVQTFGQFELFVDHVPVHFKRRKSKELLAYLVDRKGAAITAHQAAAVLWEDRPIDRALTKTISICAADMIKDLQNVGAEHIILKNKHQIAVDVTAIECDYYNFLKGDAKAINTFMEEYMSDYAWAEVTLGALCLKGQSI